MVRAQNQTLYLQAVQMNDEIMGQYITETTALRDYLHGEESTGRRIDVHELAGRTARRLFDASRAESDPAKKQRLLDLCNKVLRGEV